MQIKNLNGWQRLWILTSLIYLIFVLIVAYEDYPSSSNSFIEDKEVVKYLSTKSLQMLSDEGASIGKFSKIKEQFKLPTGQEVYLSTSYTQKDKDFIYQDYENATSKLINKKQIAFIGTMVAVWVIPCLAIYVLGLSLHWVYRGFRKKN